MERSGEQGVEHSGRHGVREVFSELPVLALYPVILGELPMRWVHPEMEWDAGNDDSGFEEQQTLEEKRGRARRRVPVEAPARQRIETYPQGIEDRREVIRQTAVSSESALFVRLGSEIREDTEAVFVIVPTAFGVTTTSTEDMAPLPIVPSVQVTIPPDSPQDPWLGVADTKLTLDGRVSVTSTL